MVVLTLNPSSMELARPTSWLGETFPLSTRCLCKHGGFARKPYVGRPTLGWGIPSARHSDSDESLHGEEKPWPSYSLDHHNSMLEQLLAQQVLVGQSGSFDQPRSWPNRSLGHRTCRIITSDVWRPSFMASLVFSQPTGWLIDSLSQRTRMFRICMHDQAWWLNKVLDQLVGWLEKLFDCSFAKPMFSVNSQAELFSWPTKRLGEQNSWPRGVGCPIC